MSRAITKLYTATVQHRHNLVHRTASFSLETKQLTGTSDAGALTPLSQSELHAFIQLAQLVARGVLSNGLDGRSLGHLHYCLQSLKRHTEMPTAEGIELQPPLNAVIALYKDSVGQWCADFAYLQEQIERRAPQQHVDVWIEIPGEAGWGLFGHLENLPSETTVIDLDKLPAYLARQ